MSLAVLSLLEASGDRALFEADTGTSEFFRLAVGAGRMERDGFAVLERVRWKGPVRRRVGGGLLRSWFRLELPMQHMDHEHRFVQLTSFKSPDGAAPAWSRVVEVWPQAVLDPRERVVGMTTDTNTTLLQGFAGTRSVSQPLMENRLSKGMFWGELLGLAEFLVPLGSKLIAGAVNKEAPGKVDAGGVEKVLATLLELIGSAATPAAAPTTAQVPGAAPAAEGKVALEQRLLARGVGPVRLVPHEARRLQSDRRRLLSSAQDFGAISGPALVGLITTLAPTVMKAIEPLMKKAPELLKAYTDSPLRLFNAIAEADRKEQELTNQQVQSMLAQGNQALLFQLLANGGGLGSGAASGLPALAGASSLGGDRRAAPKVVPGIEVRLEPTDTLEVGGKQRAVYGSAGPIALHLHIEAREANQELLLPKAIAHLRIKDSLGGGLLLEKRVRLRDVRTGASQVLELTAAEVETLPERVDLLASVELRWPDRGGRTSTTAQRAVQDLFLAGEYLLESTGARLGLERALSDPVRFRPFWHRIWEGGSAEHRRWKLETTARYYYSLRPGESRNGRVDTRFRPSDGDTRRSEHKLEWRGMLKSGMELASGELAKLQPLFDAGAPVSGEELVALDAEGFRTRVEQQATAALELRGRTEERAALWVFPVIDLVEVELLRVLGTAEDGQVTTTERVRRTFPVPVAAVFVGMEIES